MLTIPLIEGTIQKIQTTISGNKYVFTSKKNTRTGTYSVDVTVNNEEVLHGIQMVGGVDIFDGFSNVPIKCYCVNKVFPNNDFTIGELGNNNLLIVLEDSDLEA